MEPQQLEDQAARNFYLLYSAQMGWNVPVRFNADKNGNLQRVGKLRNFFICVLNRLSGAKTIDAMNDRVRNAIQNTFAALIEHVEKVENLAKESQMVSDDESKAICDALFVLPKNFVGIQPVRIDQLDLGVLWLNNVLHDFEFYTSLMQHRPQHSPLPKNYKDLELDLRQRVNELRRFIDK